MSHLFYIGGSRHGKGLFAAKHIGKGSIILTYEGALISMAQALEKGEKSLYPLQVYRNLYLDIGEPGVLVNHSCEPNSGIRSDVFLVALRDIEQNEEIVMDYSTTMSENLETMNCNCGTDSCRHIIGDFHDLPEDLKCQYLILGVVQSFIVQEHLGYLGNEEKTANMRLQEDSRSGSP